MMTTRMDTVDIITEGRSQRKARWLTVTLALMLITIGLSAATIMLGNTYYPADVVFRVLMGDEIKGATFAIQTLRLPRMLAGLLTGFAFGMAGSVFQTMLRNPLASPNIIGVTAGSSVAAVFCLLILRANGSVASLVSVLAGLAVTALIYFFSRGGGFSGGRLIIIGIGVQAMLNAVIQFMLIKASQYDVPTALRWLSGSLNTIQLRDLPALAITMAVFCPVVILLSRQLRILELGEQAATSLGVSADRVRVLLVTASVVLLAFATSTTGPIAFVSFLAGPIAKRLVGVGFSYEVPSGLTGAALVLAADLIGQFLLPVKYPVGVITGILGAPYLLYLLISMNRKGDM